MNDPGPSHFLRPSHIMMAALFGAIVVFCTVQDRVTSIGAGQYVERQRAALATGGTGVSVDDVMRPWIARSVRSGLLWSALPVAAGIVLSAVAGRRSPRG